MANDNIDESTTLNVTAEYERSMPLAVVMSHAIAAHANCNRQGNQGWSDVWQEVINDCLRLLPHGSGFDCHPHFMSERSNEERMVIAGAYHKMNDVGMYSGWIQFRVIVEPSFLTRVRLTLVGVRGRDQDHSEYITDCYHAALSEGYDLNGMVADALAAVGLEVEK